MTKPKPTISIPWSNVNWLTALIGLILLVFGQLEIAGSAFQVSTSIPLGDWLNNNLHFGIPDINNVLVGLPIFITGAVLLAVSLRGLRLLPLSSEEFAAGKTIEFRLIKSAWPWILVGLLSLAFLLIQLGRLTYKFYSPILWIVTLIMFATTMAVWDHRRQVDLSPHISRKDLFWMIGLLIAGFLISTYRLQGWPDQLMGDEGNFYTISRDIARGVYKPPIFGSGVYSFPIFSSYLQGWVMKLFGIDLWGWRMASVLPGLLTVIPLYLLARDAFNKRIAIASSIALICSPYFLAFSRLGYNNIQALFVTALALYFIFNGLRRSSILLTFLAGCAGGFGFYTYFGARGTLVIALLFIVLLWLTRKITFKQAAFSTLILSLGAALVMAPYFVYGLHEDAETMGYKVFESVFFNIFNGSQYYSNAELFKYAPVIHFGGNDLFFNPQIYLILFTQGLIRTLLVFQKPWLISEHYIAFPLAGTIGVFFYLIGLGLALRKIKEPRNLLLLIWFLVIILGFSALNTVPPRHTHMVAIIPALAMFTGIGLNALTRALEYVHSWLKRHATIIFASLLTLLVLGGTFDYFILAPRKYHPNWDQIISWAVLDSNGESFYYIFQDPSQKDFNPYIRQEFRQSVPYQLINYSDVINGKVTFPSNQSDVIFYSPELAAKITPILQAQLGAGLIQRIFYNSDGDIPVLSAGMNTPFVFERDRPILSTFLDSPKHLAFIIFIALLFLFLALAILLPHVRLPSPGWITRLLAWFKHPDQSQEAEEDTQDEELLLQSTSPRVSPSSADKEPPAWADQLDHPEQPPDKDRFSFEMKPVDSARGKDFYIHLHIPCLHIPWIHLPKDYKISIPALNFPDGILLIILIVLAFIAQFMISRQLPVVGAILYLASASVLVLWVRRNRKWTNVLTNQMHLSPRIEIILATVLLLAVAVTRFYDLGYRVYGLEADETKWTVQSWYSTILRVDQGEFAGAHYDFLPVTFWVRSFFLKIFGLNFISARIESAVFSLFSTLFLYLLVRRLTASPPMAWLSTLLYSFSFIELNVSHQALHNTTIEIWMISGLFLLILSLQERKWWQSQLAGIILALGMLTYETYFPTPLIATVFFIGYCFFRIGRKKDAPLPWLRRFFLFIWPIVLIYFIYIQRYIDSQSYHFEFLVQSSGSGANIRGLIEFLLQNTREYLTTMFSHVVWTDSLINWSGSLINPLLIAFVVIGLVYNLLNLRKALYIFIPLWFLVNLLYAPILVGSVWPRILYTTLGPLVIWGAMGLWIFLSALRYWLDGLKLKLAVPVFLFALTLLVFNDYHIFTSSLTDPVERQKRRELADLTTESAGSVQMILFPYIPNEDDSLYVESHILRFAIASGHHTGLEVDNFYRQIPFDQALITLNQDKQLDSLDLFFDKTAPDLVTERQAALKTILGCYPEAVLKVSGRFFDVYSFDSESLGQPKCYQSLPPVLISPPDGASLETDTPTTLEWDPQGTQFTAYSLTIERKSTESYWIETESTFAGPGWSTSADYVSGFNGTGFLLDNWEAGTASYTLPVGEAGDYRLWVRSYKRQQNDQVNFITINGIKTEFASNDNPLNQWVWEDLGEYSLPAGDLPIDLTRSYGNDQEYSVFIDTILLTPDLVDPPDQVRIWENVLSTEKIFSSSTEFTLPQPLPPGEYRWKVRIFNGTALIDASGAQGVESQVAVFSVQP
jgi:4-amino-4-deoxy-L-arabinose transferase-like glycosyltransferase